MKNQTKKIQDLLKLYNHNLKKVPIVSRQTVLLEMTKDLEAQEAELGRYLKRCGGKLAYLNSKLQDHNLPVLKRLKSSLPLFKILFIVLGSGLLIMALSFYFLIDKYLPLYQYNEVDNTVSLLGGEVLMVSDSVSYFSKRNYAYDSLEIEDRDFSYSFNAEISVDEFSSIFINAKNIDLYIEASYQNSLSVDCRSSVIESSNDMNVDSNRLLRIHFKGTQQCNMRIPKNIFLKIEAQKAAIFSKKIANDFEMKFMNSYVTLKKDDLKLYRSLDAKIESDIDFPVNGKYQGKILSDSGKVFIR